MIDDFEEMGGISLRLLNALNAAGIETVGQFIALRREDFLAMPGIGPVTADEAERLRLKLAKARLN